MEQPDTHHVSRSDAPAGDDGFTLVEMVVALFLLGIVAMAALGLFVNGLGSVTDFQRQQAAASLAGTALDRARSVTATAGDYTGTSGVLQGRTQTAVRAVWDEATALEPSDTADMTLEPVGFPAAWDPAPGHTAADQWVPVRTTHTVDNQQYTVDTLIGVCFRLKTSPTTGQACTATRSSGDDAEMYRVRVVVRWDTGDGPESYRVATLIDPSTDAIWNTALLPYAYDDEFTVFAGGTTTFHAIVANDAIEVGSSSPIVNTTNPDVGSYTLGTGSASNGIYFNPPGNVSGTVSFTYHVRDAAGLISAVPATVLVHILPSPVDDDLAVEPNTTTELNDLLLDNDTGVPNLSPDRETTIVPFLDPTVDYFETEEVTPEITAARNADIAALAARGVTMDPDGTVRFQAPAGVGETTTFQYYLVDDNTGGADNARYANTAEPATVTIITEAAALIVEDEEFDLSATSSQTWHDLDWRTLTGNEDDVRIRIRSVTGGSSTHVRIDGSPVPAALGHDLEFRTTNNNVGIYRLEYELVSPGGTVSDPGTLTVTVAPFAPNRSGISVQRSYWWSTRTVDINLASQGIPSTNVRVVALGAPTCGSVARLNDTTVRFTAPTSTGNCTFTYRLESTGTPSVRSHDPGTVTVRVT
ncbi:Ig-like domain-containing protein [Demequina sp. NBRC 110053]|uniref:type IV pilus modification PilV family protein n=1 Tax=Demequina sp. NBRC 110053 TaxID=1570342 RepID=UPI0009FDED4B|nr:type II secretion system protein [Demequina sp. NBRC 110053]